MKGLVLHISLFLVLGNLSAQGLEVQGSARLDVAGQMDVTGEVNNDGSVYILGEGSELVVFGNLNNAGSIQNTGTLSLGADWLTNSTFNGIGGTLAFIGSNDHVINPDGLVLGELALNKSNTGVVTGLTDYTIENTLTLNSGIVVLDDATTLSLSNGVEAVGGSNASFVEGRLTRSGSAVNFNFPVGIRNGANNQPTFGELVLVGAQDGTYTTQFVLTNSDLNPDRLLLGVSADGLWQVTSTANSTVRSIILDYENQDLDLADLSVFNDLTHSFRTPSVVVSDTLEGSYSALPLLPDDQIIQYEGDQSIPSDGVIQSADTTVGFIADQIKYIAVGVTPIVPAGGVVYIPNVFSPRASDPLNQRFRVFFDELDDFSEIIFEVYNRFGEQVYSTNDLLEAKENGWDGTNARTGNDAPTGSYFYAVRLLREDGRVFEEQGSVFLQR